LGQKQSEWAVDAWPFGWIPGLADENESVRDVALSAGHVLVEHYATTYVVNPLFFPRFVHCILVFSFIVAPELLLLLHGFFFLSIQSVDVCVNSWVTSSVLALGSPGHFRFCFLLWKTASLMIVGAYVRALWNSWVICYSRFAKSLFFFINISYSFFPPFT
jgi:hypothetical protein